MADVLRSTRDGVVCIGRLDLGVRLDCEVVNGFRHVLRLPFIRPYYAGFADGSPKCGSVESIALSVEPFVVGDEYCFGINADSLEVSTLRMLRGFIPISTS